YPHAPQCRALRSHAGALCWADSHTSLPVSSQLKGHAALPRAAKTLALITRPSRNVASTRAAPCGKSSASAARTRERSARTRSSATISAEYSRLAAPDDLVLHVKQVCDRFVEALGPNVIASFSVDQLRVDANTIAAALHAAFEDVAHVELASDLLHVRGLALVGECRVACDDESASYA